MAVPTGTPSVPTGSPTRHRAICVQAGTVIPAALITGIRSDLPGEITAQVTEAVYDTPSGKYLLIPQGARLIGKYDSQVAFGQSRVLLVWDRIIMPDGKSIVLERQEGADTQGYAGLEDDVDYHWWELAKAAVLSTLLGVGSDLGTNGSNDSDLVHALREGAQDSLSNTGQQLVRRQLNVQPTLTIRPGFPVRVIVNRDLVLAPYAQGGNAMTKLKLGAIQTTSLSNSPSSSRPPCIAIWSPTPRRSARKADSPRPTQRGSSDR